MSRYTVKKDDKTLIYGYDRALGFFYEVWDSSELDRMERFDEDSNLPYPKAEIDKDQLFSDLDVFELVEVLTVFKCDRNHIWAIGNELEI